VIEAWATWDDGHRLASQALATAALGTVVHDPLSYAKFADLRNDAKNVPGGLDEWPLIEIRYRLLLYRTAVALEQTPLGLPRYKRHGSAHKVDPAQYTNANALHAQMLVTAWVGNCTPRTGTSTTTAPDGADRSYEPPWPGGGSAEA
jgi:hypothetical protein